MPIKMHVSTYMYTFQVDDTQQGVDHVRKQDEDRESSKMYAKHADDTCS